MKLLQLNVLGVEVRSSVFNAYGFIRFLVGLVAIPNENHMLLEPDGYYNFILELASELQDLLRVHPPQCCRYCWRWPYSPRQASTLDLWRMLEDRDFPRIRPPCLLSRIPGL